MTPEEFTLTVAISSVTSIFGWWLGSKISDWVERRRQAKGWKLISDLHVRKFNNLDNEEPVAIIRIKKKN